MAPPFGMTSSNDDLRDLEAFGAHARELEARIAEAERTGADVPAEARMMLASLRDLAAAVEGLRGTLGGSQTAPGDGAALRQATVDEGQEP